MLATWGKAAVRAAVSIKPEEEDLPKFPLGFAFLIAVAAHYMARTNALSWVRTLCMQLMLDNI